MDDRNYKDVVENEGLGQDAEKEAMVRLEIKKTMALVEEGRAERKQQLPTWIRGIKYWIGKQWDERNQKKAGGKKWNEATINQCYSSIAQQVAMLTENNPRGTFVAVNPDDEEFARHLGSMTQNRARNLNFRTHLIRGCYDAKCFGFQATHVFWDDQFPGNADVNIRLLDPKELLIDPWLKTSTPEDGRFIGFEREVSLDYLESRFPKHAEQLRKEATRSNGVNAGVNNDTAPVIDDIITTEGRTTANGWGGGGITGEEDVNVPTVQLISIWYRDYSLRTVTQKAKLDTLMEDGRVIRSDEGFPIYADTGILWNEDNSPEISYEIPAYPYGRYRMMTEQVILVDTAWGHDPIKDEYNNMAWPIAIGINSVVPGKWFGMNEIEQIRTSQDILNTQVSSIQDHNELNLHPKTKVGEGAVLNSNNGVISSSPNSVMVMAPGRFAEFDQMSPRPIGPDAYKIAELALSNIEQTVALSSSMQSKAPDHTATATEIASLERAGRGRIGMNAALLDEYVARIYLLIGQSIQANYDINKLIRVLGPEGQDIAIKIAEKHKTIKYDVVIEASATMPHDKERRKQDLMQVNQLMSQPTPMLPELLDVFEIGNKRELLQRNESWQLFMQYLPLLQDPNFQIVAQQYAQQMQTPQQQGV